ncbi:hypothetical protein ASPBRDRAFT_49893 [Aspergillus brasiliensis CBS 101740]|uniref:Major facilitator superfamily (MFS) profile domain-containing protein n=1 Tax=Aspergillus brasiliensis (strain CBS 101740 / IMI 381727 / IBT 21946) TaxID=767769 RepID=A0A1L9UYU8_ASPBC|nr:hypothetical protein ASPBRDRAFT_49893 [Aspergillus brasiliensis CBS 101740]
MQSIRQYRRIDRAVQGRLKRAAELSKTAQADSNVSVELSALPGNNQDTTIIPVQWDDDDSYLNPRQYSVPRKAAMTFLVAIIAVAVTASSAIDAAGAQEYKEYFGVSSIVASLPTALFLIGFALGSLISGPFSETFGRSIVYIMTLILFLIFIMASALAPDVPSHIVFRFLAGLFAATPLTCAGGTVSDLWNPLEKTYGFPIYAITAFTGPMVGQQETYTDLLLQWKAEILRKRTGDPRYKGPMELRSLTLGQRLAIAVSRPFAWGVTEPIIIFMSLYLTVVYAILFLFLDGYPFIFTDIYHFSEGLTNIVWVAMVIGTLSTALQVPIIWSWTKREFQNTGHIRPETRLWSAMLGGAISIPVSLFWLAWTSSAKISVWSPICATVLFGFGITTVFISAHMYVIDAYEKYSASALAMLVLSRYLVAGGMTIAGDSIYSSFGVRYTLTTLGSISVVMALIPYVFYKYGHVIRKGSAYAIVHK